MALSEEAAAAAPAPGAAESDPRPALVSLDQIREVSQDAHHVLVNGEPFLDAGEHAAAAHCVALLRSLAGLPKKRRGAAIDRELRRATSADAVRKTVSAFLRGTALLRLVCGFLLLLLCFLGVMALDPGLTNYWPPYLYCLFGSIGVVLVGFLTTHKRLYPGAAGPRWRIFSTLLLPTMAARACDVLSRPLLARYHPLAVAAALCDGRTFHAMARRALLDLRHAPLPFAEPERSFRPRLARALEALAAREGFDPVALTAPPAPEDPANVSYCPRCDRQYLVASGTCADCGGIALCAFADAPAAPSPPAPEAG